MSRVPARRAIHLPRDRRIRGVCNSRRKLDGLPRLSIQRTRIRRNHHRHRI